MDDATRKQVIGVLARLIYETTHGSPMEDDGSHKCVISKEALAGARYTYDALTALKAIQPRPDLVVAAREVIAKRIGNDECFSVAEFYRALDSLKAALADEQEWEVGYALNFPSGWYSQAYWKDEETALYGAGAGAKAVPVYIPKAKPQPVSREHAIEDAAREMLGLALRSLNGDGISELTWAACTQRVEAAIARKVQP